MARAVPRGQLPAVPPEEPLRIPAGVLGDAAAAELVAFLGGALTLWLLDPATVALSALSALCVLGESYLTRL
ncbi:hypothetical protein BN6_04570 [Saccharothrix espanaensis DSM 44229]|uniref:Uncharacterized protein n=1 Tax=Saccharothrix espanaensis (strain ATCC 51144 / DSM 44229 / JCM 9112 / NBRC 15066 / NRRL 15764) TaxID=1179773 RepID=K0JU68_SACES|nr:hypothetical protein BN6_04570 [Saccharothrix espanaensis DSM 44229]